MVEMRKLKMDLGGDASILINQIVSKLGRELLSHIMFIFTLLSPLKIRCLPCELSILKFSGYIDTSMSPILSLLYPVEFVAPPTRKHHLFRSSGIWACFC